jgi:hypothetical protein
MLLSVQGLYDDWIDQGFDLPRWRKNDDVIAWLIELGDQPGFMDKMDEVAQAYDSQLTSLVENIRAVHGLQDSEADFVALCLLMIAILDKFSEIMRLPVLAGTKYTDFYLSVVSDFEELRQSIVESANTKKVRGCRIAFRTLHQ